MADCVTPLDKDTTERISGLIRIKKQVIDDKSAAGDFIRAALGLHYRQTGLGTGAMEGAFKQWVRDLVGVDIRKNARLPSKSDLAVMQATLNDGIAKFNDAQAYAQGMLKKAGGDPIKALRNAKETGRLVGKIRKAMPLTKRVQYIEKLVGGNHVYDNMVMIKQRGDVRREAAEGAVRAIVEKIETITGSKNDKEIRALAELNVEIGNANDQLEIYRQMKIDKKLTPEFATKMKQTQTKLEDMLRKKGVMETAFETHPIGVLMNRMIDVIEAEGRPRKYDTLLGKLSNDLRVDAVQLSGLASDIKTFLDPFVELGKETSQNAKDLISLHLERLGMPDAAREEFVDSILNFEEITEGYFPRIYVGAKDGVFLQDLVNKLSEQTFINEQAAKGNITRMVADFMKHRTTPVEATGRNRNVIDVLLKYSQQMLHTNFVTSASRELESQISTIWDIAQKSNGKELDIYLEAYKNELDVLRADVMGTADHGINAQLSRSAHALYATAKLGALNIGGWARNYGEGTAMLVAAVGLGGIKRAQKIMKDNKAQIETYTEGEKVDLDVKRFWENENMAYDAVSGMVEKYGEDLVHKNLGVKLEHDAWVRRVVMEIEKGTSAFAQAALKIGWSPVENKARSQAHRVGSALGFQEAESRYKPLFQTGRVPESVIKKFRLDGEKVRSQDPEEYMGEYSKLAKEITNRKGFEIMGQTQWIYDKMERHYIEGWSPFGLQVGKGMAMFQHYGISWTSAMYLAFARTAGRVKAGGLKAGLTGSTKEAENALFKGKSFNRDAVYLSSMLAAIAGGAWLADEEGLGKAIGVRVYGVFAHPIVDWARGFKDLSSDENRPRAFYGKGVVSTVTGPPVQDVMNLVNIGLLEAGYGSETWPEELAEGLKHTIGLSPTPDDANWDIYDRTNSLIYHLQRSTPMTSKGLPVLQAARDKNGSEVIRGLARYVFNTDIQWNRKDTEEMTEKQRSNIEAVKERKKAINREEQNYAQ